MREHTTRARAGQGSGRAHPPRRPARPARGRGLPWASLGLALGLLACGSKPAPRCEPRASLDRLTLSPNTDDDNRDGVRDGLGPLVEGDDEALSLSVSSGCGAPVEVVLEGIPAGEVRVWGDAGALGAGASVGPAARLRVDAVRGRSGAWGGEGALVLRAAGASLRLPLRVRPFVLPAPEAGVCRLRAVAAPGGPSLAAPLRAAGLAFDEIDPATTGQDLWLPDSFLPLRVAGGPGLAWLRTTRPMTAAMTTWADRSALGPGVGVVSLGAASSAFDGSGNLLVVSPHVGRDGRAFPLGRVLHGGGAQGSLSGEPREARVSQAMRRWIDAQGEQRPAIELPTAWLRIGHLDEMLMPLPSPPGRVLVAVAAPRRAIALSAALTPALRSFNERAAARIDEAREALRAEIREPAVEFVELPVLYGPVAQDGATLARSMLGNAVNLVRAGGAVIVPEPRDERGHLHEAFRAEIERAFAAVALPVVFVHTGAYSALAGDAHCAIQAEPCEGPRGAP